MKKYTLLTIAPVLALMAVGCSSPIAMQSTEYDDMYYSASDKTEYVQEPGEATASAEQQYREYDEPAAEEALSEGEVLNPEYAGSEAAVNNYYSEEYYDGRSYNPRDNWYQPSYSFVDPYWGAAYSPRMASYAYYDPFYDPFYNDPFYYSSFRRNPYWNNGLSVSISYGMGWGGHGFYNRPYSNWFPGSYGYDYYNGYRHGFHNGYYASNPYYGGFYDRPVVITNPVRLQNRPRDTRSAVVTERSSTAGRPARGNVYEGENSEGRQSVSRPVRRGEAASSPTNSQESKATLESRPTRPSRTIESRQRRTTQEQPALERQQQQQRVLTPGRTERRSTRTQEYRQPEQQQQRTRTIESRPIRTQESQPVRTYESRPSRSFESSPSPSSSPAQSSGSSGGGGRPRRGN
ncbi:hypothetical protein GCM10023188_01360 [Pontibacter saemangeumensis]|uniref:Uncharacterized protein n=1 Tax=Pontibacter saemangeumensis TaxID=1084525 RepID=A0ABP8L569_9BACT